LDIELENLKKKTQNIENQQNEAIEKENFEEADQLEIILKQHHESVNFFLNFLIIKLNDKDSCC
jgi:hypothetical protein